MHELNLFHVVWDLFLMGSFQCEEWDSGRHWKLNYFIPSSLSQAAPSGEGGERGRRERGGGAKGEAGNRERPIGQRARDDENEGKNPLTLTSVVQDGKSCPVLASCISFPVYLESYVPKKVLSPFFFIPWKARRAMFCLLLTPEFLRALLICEVRGYNYQFQRLSEHKNQLKLG